LNCSCLPFFFKILVTVFLSYTIYYIIVNNNFINQVKSKLYFSFKKTFAYFIYKNLKKNLLNFRYILYISILLFLIFYIYCSNEDIYFFLKIFFSILILILLDLIVSLFIIPLLQRVLLTINYEIIYINKDNLFNYHFRNQYYRNNTIILIYPYNYTDHLNVNLSAFRYLIWLIELYDKRYRIYYYTLLIILIDTFFFIITYKYFFNEMHSIILFSYTTIWMILEIIKIKEFTGFTFFEKFFSSKIYERDTRFFLKNLSIKKYKNNQFLNYSIEDILDKVNNISKISRQNIEQFTLFISTVLYIGILTFIGWG